MFNSASRLPVCTANEYDDAQHSAQGGAGRAHAEDSL